MLVNCWCNVDAEVKNRQGATGGGVERYVDGTEVPVDCGCCRCF